MGASLLCITRNKEKSEALKREIDREFGVPYDYILADLSSMNAVRHLAEQLLAIPRPIDVMIHNAGVFLTRQELTEEGIDKVFMVQHLSSFMLNVLLADKLRAQKVARILLVNSEGHRFAAWGLKLDDLNWEKRRYSGMKSYGSAKLAQLLTMHVFAEYFKDSGVTINAMHPGAVKSDTGQENGPLYRWYKKNILDRTLRPTEISSESLYYLGVASEVVQESGQFFNLTTLETPAPPALDIEAACEIWKKSIRLTGLENEIPELTCVDQDTPHLVFAESDKKSITTAREDDKASGDSEDKNDSASRAMGTVSDRADKTESAVSDDRLKRKTG
jgi:NAD(P)-dependent dehydrogenase (short-subunit alcohol dehydrogenase family)